MAGMSEIRVEYADRDGTLFTAAIPRAVWNTIMEAATDSLRSGAELSHGPIPESKRDAYSIASRMRFIAY